MLPPQNLPTMLSLVLATSATLGKSTYAMTHPFAYKAFMEKYFPTAENVVQANSTTNCVEWVKLCIDDGTTPFECSGPQGNLQLHSVGAYKRDSGTLSMETIGALRDLHSRSLACTLPLVALLISRSRVRRAQRCSTRRRWAT